MSSFFTLPKPQKRKRSDAPGASAPKKPRTSNSNTGSSRGGRPPSSRGQRGGTRGGAASKPLSRSRPTADDDDESISGSASSVSGGDEGYESASTDAEIERETEAEKRLRLAEEYLEKVRGETARDADAEYGFDAEEIDRDLIAERLKEDVAEQKGKLYRFVARSFGWDKSEGRFFRDGSEGAVTAVALDGQGYVFTATKDLRIIKWRIPESRDTDGDGKVDLRTDYEQKDTAKPELSKAQRRKLRAKRKKEQGGDDAGSKDLPILVASTRGSHKRKKDNTYNHHVGPILCIATSPSGHLVVSGGADKRIIVWDAATLEPKRVFTQHRDAVTGLAFRRNANQMFSASADRTIKVWSMDELAYVETLFGHQDEVLDVGALGMERCVSVGGRDRTARVWKVVEETQLVFRGGGSAAERESKRDRKRGVTSETKLERADKKARSALGEGSIDRVALVDDEMFITGSDNGSLSLWSVQKKKPVHVIPTAHGLDPQMTLEEAFPDKEMDDDREIPGPPLPRSITALAVLPYSDVVISGSWEGFLRVWRISDDKKKLELVGTLGEKKDIMAAPISIRADGLVNGVAKKLTFDTEDITEPDPVTNGANGTLPNGEHRIVATGTVVEDEEEPKNSNDRMLNGENEDANKQSQSTDQAKRQPFSGVVNDLKITERGDRGKETLVIAAAIGKEQRLGRWRTFPGQNGACVFEISKGGALQPAVDGVADLADGDDSF